MASLVLVSGAMAAAACGSSDKRVAVRERGGDAGDAGAAGAPGRQPIPQGGTSTEPDVGGARLDGGGLGGAPAIGGVPANGGVPTIGEAGAAAAAGAAGAAGAGGQDGAPNERVVDIGFDDANTLPANLEPGTATLTPSQGFAPLGPAGNQFGSKFLRGPTGTVITLTLSDLPPHQALSLSLLFAAIDSLDGEGTFPAGDYFKITLDGVVIFRESFANAVDSQIQSYNPPPEVVLARHQNLGFQGPGGYYTDSAYDFGLDPKFQNIAHVAWTAVLVFTLEGEGVQSIDDESWAIDNIRVTAH